MAYTQPGMEYTSPEHITRLTGLQRPALSGIDANVAATALAVPVPTDWASLLSVGDWVEIWDSDEHPYHEFREITGFSNVGAQWSYVFTGGLTYAYTQASAQTQKVSHFSPISNPTRSQLVEMIEDNQEVWNQRTHHNWYAEGRQEVNRWCAFMPHYRRIYPYFYHRPHESIDTFWRIQLPHQHIKTFDTTKDDVFKVYTGNDFLDWLDPANAKVEWDADTAVGSRSDDYWVDYRNGIIYFTSDRPLNTSKGVYLTYRYGQTADGLQVPSDISKAVAMMTAIDIYMMEPFAINFPGGFEEQKGNQKIDKMLERWNSMVEQAIARRREHMIHDGGGM